MAYIGLVGSVVTRVDGMVVTYQQKCEKCGELGSKCTSQMSPTGTYNSSFVCRKCHKQQEVKVKGDKL